MHIIVVLQPAQAADLKGVAIPDRILAPGLGVVEQDQRAAGQQPALDKVDIAVGDA